MTFAAEQGLLMWEAWTGFPHGWVVGELGDGQAGIAELQKGWAQFEANGGRWSRPYYLASLAEVYRKVGRITDGLTALSDALGHVEVTEERFYEAELHRLKGELIFQQSHDVAEAETCFHRAIAIAQSQQTKSWELRASTSLARLWHGQGKTVEARELLAPAYNWFTEGFDTADLKDAEALLEAVSNPSVNQL